MEMILFFLNKKSIMVSSNVLFLKNFNNFIFFLISNLCKAITFVLVKNMQVHLYVKNEFVYDVVFFLKHSCLVCCNQLLDLTMVDSMEFVKTNFRWEFVYMFLSINYNVSVFVSGYLKTFGNLNSIVTLFSSANWLESELWDMFGIFMKNHPDLSSILTDYAFMGSPLSKDFPLYGYVELSYDEQMKTMVVEPLGLMQEYSDMSLENVWRKTDMI